MVQREPKLWTGQGQRLQKLLHLLQLLLLPGRDLVVVPPDRKVGEEAGCRH